MDSFSGSTGRNRRCKVWHQSWGSHLCLQVHDLLAHQWNGGASLFPLHRLPLQRGGCHSFQVFPYPGWRRMCLPNALPCSFTGGWLLVLLRKRHENRVMSDVSLLVWWTHFTLSCFSFICQVARTWLAFEAHWFTSYLLFAQTITDGCLRNI